MFREQHGGCAICGRPPKNLPLAVDHCHKMARLKIRSKRLPDGRWRAFEVTYKIGFRSPNKKKAIKHVKLKLLRKSVRGLLCWVCNTALRKWLDDPKRMLAGAKYLRKHGEKCGWQY